MASEDRAARAVVLATADFEFATSADLASARAAVEAPIAVTSAPVSAYAGAVMPGAPDLSAMRRPGRVEGASPGPAESLPFASAPAGSVSAQPATPQSALSPEGPSLGNNPEVRYGGGYLDVLFDLSVIPESSAQVQAAQVQAPQVQVLPSAGTGLNGVYDRVQGLPEAPSPVLRRL